MERRYLFAKQIKSMESGYLVAKQIKKKLFSRQISRCRQNVFLVRVPNFYVLHKIPLLCLVSLNVASLTCFTTVNVRPSTGV